MTVTLVTVVLAKEGRTVLLNLAGGVKTALEPAPTTLCVMLLGYTVPPWRTLSFTVLLGKEDDEEENTELIDCFKRASLREKSSWRISPGCSSPRIQVEADDLIPERYPKNNF